jgi:S-methylmethionine-dependent homocysteine/selenocysteine methylase
MNTSKNTLPQMNGGLFLTDGGIETTLIYHDGFDLPYFAAFDLFKDEKGTRALRRYFARHAAIARKNGMGFILESATWRASRDWAEKLGYSAARLEEVNRKAIALLRDIKAEYETPNSIGLPSSSSVALSSSAWLIREALARMPPMRSTQGSPDISRLS